MNYEQSFKLIIIDKREVRIVEQNNGREIRFCADGLLDSEFLPAMLAEAFT